MEEVVILLVGRRGLRIEIDLVAILILLKILVQRSRRALLQQELAQVRILPDEILVTTTLGFLLLQWIIIAPILNRIALRILALLRRAHFILQHRATLVINSWIEI